MDSRNCSIIVNTRSSHNKYQNMIRALSPSTPLVTIIVPFFNQELFLQECIESVIQQSFQDWELLLINDGSTDNSPLIAQEFVNQFPDKIFLFYQPNNKNLGASSARNIGVKNAKGKYITFLDSDDVYISDAIEKELLAFKNNPEADVVCGALQFWYSWENESNKNESDFVVNLGLETNRLYPPLSLLIHNLRANGRKPGINCIMMTHDFINSIGAFEGDFQYVSEDQVFWAKVSLNGKIYVMEKCLAKYRQHNSSSVAVLIKNDKEIENWEVFLNWLQNYLEEKNIKNQNIWDSFNYCKNNIKFQAKFSFLKKLYRKFFSLHFRYWLRDKIISWRLDKN